MMQTNEAGLEFIKKAEGLRLEAYRDVVGVWTIGYGHTSMAGKPEVKAGLKITAAEATEILKRDIQQYENAVAKAITKPINENQFSAFVSLCYNAGIGAFSGSTAVRRFNAGDTKGAAEAILFWNKAGGKVVQGLVNRRAAEKRLFETGSVVHEVPDVVPTQDKPFNLFIVLLNFIIGLFKK